MSKTRLPKIRIKYTDRKEKTKQIICHSINIIEQTESACSVQFIGEKIGEIVKRDQHNSIMATPDGKPIMIDNHRIIGSEFGILEYWMEQIEEGAED